MICGSGKGVALGYIWSNPSSVELCMREVLVMIITMVTLKTSGGYK